MPALMCFRDFVSLGRRSSHCRGEKFLWGSARNGVMLLECERGGDKGHRTVDNHLS